MSATAAATIDEDALLAKKIFIMDQLTNLYGFPTTVAEKALQNVGIIIESNDTGADDSDLVMIYCNYILENNLASDSGGPVVPRESCPHTKAIDQSSAEVTCTLVPTDSLPLQPHLVSCQHDGLESGSNSKSTVSAGLKKGDDDDAPCNLSNENWICLHCGTVRCSRYQKAHSVAHYESSDHPLALSLVDMSVWCYPCQVYIDTRKIPSVQAIVDRVLELRDTPTVYLSSK